MKLVLGEAGYKDIENLNSLLKNSVGGFTFNFHGAHGHVDIPVLEFKNNTVANDYAKYINAN